MSKLQNNTVTMAFRADDDLARRIDFYCKKLALDKTSLLKMCVKLMLDKLDKQGGSILFEDSRPEYDSCTIAALKKVADEIGEYDGAYGSEKNIG